MDLFEEIARAITKKVTKPKTGTDLIGQTMEAISSHLKQVQMKTQKRVESKIYIHSLRWSQ